MRVSTTALTALLALSPLLSSSTAWTQPKDPPESGRDAQPSSGAAREEAKRRFDRGVELYREANHEAALIEFRRSYELTHEYRVLYNIAQVCFQLKDYVCALTDFEGYLGRAGDDVSSERRHEVQDSIAKLRDRIGLLDLRTNVVGADVSVDDTPRGKTPLGEPILVGEGRHKITIIKEGRVPVTQTVDIAGHEKRLVQIDLVDASGRQVVVREQQAPREPSRWTPLSYAGLAATALFAGGATFFGVSALNDASAVRDARFVGDPPADVSSAESKMERNRVLCDVFAATALVTFSVTLAYTFLHDLGGQKTAGRPGPSRSVSFLTRPTEVRVEGQF